MTASGPSKNGINDTLIGNTRLHAAALLAIVLLIYSNTFNAPFIYDDFLFIVNNPEVRDMANLWPPSGSRWLGFLSFALNYRFGGLSTTGYHVVNLAIHMVNALLVYWFVALTFRTPFFKRSAADPAPPTAEPEPSTAIAFAAAVLFACHPVQTQAVTYIWQRLTSLATMFYLLSLVLYVKARFLMPGQAQPGGPGTVPVTAGRPVRYALYVTSLLSAVLAMKSKEISFTLPVVVALYEFSFFGATEEKGQAARGRKLILYLLPFLLTLLIIPLSIFGPDWGAGGANGGIAEQLRSLQQMDAENLPRTTYLLTQVRVIVTYLRLLLLPVNQNLVYDYPVHSTLLDGEVLLALALHLSLLGIAFYLFFASGGALRVYGRLISFGIVWFYLTLSVESSIIPIKHVIFEHRIYLPSVGFFLAGTSAIGMAAARWPGARKALPYAFVLALIALSVAAFARNGLWSDDARMWEDVARKSPSLAEPHNNLGAAYAKKGYYDKAAAAYQRALQIDPKYQDARVNLSKVYLDQGKDDQAFDVLAAAGSAAESPGYHNNLGLLFARQGKMERARDEFLAALRIDPGSADVRYNLGRVYAETGDLIAAVAEYEHALTVAPDLIDAHYELGLSYAELGRIADGISEFETVLRLNPQDSEARGHLEMLRRQATTQP